MALSSAVFAWLWKAEGRPMGRVSTDRAGPAGMQVEAGAATSWRRRPDQAWAAHRGWQSVIGARALGPRTGERSTRSPACWAGPRPSARHRHAGQAGRDPLRGRLPAGRVHEPRPGARPGPLSGGSRGHRQMVSHGPGGRPFRRSDRGGVRVPPDRDRRGCPSGGHRPGRSGPPRPDVPSGYRSHRPLSPHLGVPTGRGRAGGGPAQPGRGQRSPLPTADAYPQVRPARPWGHGRTDGARWAAVPSRPAATPWPPSWLG